MSGILATRITLAALFGLGVYTIQIFARTNGLFSSMEAFQQKQLLPDHKLSYDPAFTGVKQLDDLMGFVLMFFWPIIDGNHPSLSLVSAAFAGQGLAAWVVTMIEGFRSGNRSRLIAFTAIYGTAAQLLGMGMVGPLYLLMHTLSSPTALSPSTSSLTPTSPRTLAAIPASITLAYTLPAIVMCLPTTLLPQQYKILAHHTWQIFPISASAINLLLSTIWPYNPPTTPRNSLKYLRLCYKFALAVAAPVHVATMSLSVSAYLFPGLFADGAVEMLQPQNVFLPSEAPFRGWKVGSVTQGALWFIQWDYALVGAAYLVWALALRQSARRFVNDKERFGLEGFAKVGVRYVVLGPVGAAVAYLWERDELVLGKVDGVKKNI